jgi:hypothetical protein
MIKQGRKYLLYRDVHHIEKYRNENVFKECYLVKYGDNFTFYFAMLRIPNMAKGATLWWYVGQISGARFQIFMAMETEGVVLCKVVKSRSEDGGSTDLRNDGILPHHYRRHNPEDIDFNSA